MVPKNAKIAYKGNIFTVYEWEQKLYDGSKMTYEAAERKPSVQIITIYKNKIILLDEEQPYGRKGKGMPGGMIEDNETPLEAAKRELKEETGLKGELFPWKTWQTKGHFIWKSYYFIAKDCKKIAKPHLDPGEKIKILELDFDEFVKHTQRKDFRNPTFKQWIKEMKDTNELEDFEDFLFQ